MAFSPRPTELDTEPPVALLALFPLLVLVFEDEFFPSFTGHRPPVCVSLRPCF